MGCEYIYNGQKYTFDEMAALLENGLADDLLRKNVITDAGAFATLEDKTPQTIQMTPSDTSVDLKNTRRFVRTIANQAKSVVKALRKLAPNLNLTIHTTEEAWNALYDKLLTEGYTPEDLANFKNTDGFYTEDGVIHLNAPLMEKRNRQSVLYHEASHAVTNALFNSRPELRNQMAGQITQLANDPSVDPKYKQAIQRTINFGQSYLNYKNPDGTPMYDEDFAKNETIVEFISKICTGEIQITPKEKSAWETLVSILNKLGIMVGFNVRLNNQDVTVNNVLEFANTLNKAFKSGKEISFEEAATELADENKIETPTTSADFVGQEVIYNGERGTITQDEGGKITFETDTKVYDFDGSEEVKPVNKYKYNEESNTISIGDKNYRVLNVNRQASYPEGEVIFKSVNVADANNKKKTLRDPELAKQVYESQQQRGIIPSMSEDVEIDSEALAKEIASPIVEDNNIITPVRASIKTSNLGSESDAITESKFKKALIPSFSNEEAKKVYESENAVSTPIGNSGIRKITAFDNNLFNNLLERGKILFNVPSLSMNNQIGVVSHPDSMMVGQLRGMLLDKKGKPILNEDGLPDFVIATGSGGVYFATGDIWAFKKQSGGESFVRKINNLLKIAKRTNPDNPVVYFFLGKGGPGKMLSNKESPAGVVKIYENLHRSKLISDNVLRQSIEAALKLSEVKMDADYKKREAKVEKMKEDSDKQKENKEIAKQKLEAYKKEIEKRKAKNLKQIEKLIKSKGVSIEDILDDVFSENGSFEDRGSAIKDFLAKSFTFAKKEKTEGKLIEYFGIKNVTTQDAFMDEVSKMLFEEPILLDVPKQHIYAAIKIDSPIEEYGGEHTTYESHVRFQEPGKVPTLIFFDKPFLSEGSFEDLESGEVLTKEYLGYTNVPMSQDVKARITPSMSEDIRAGDLTSASSAYENMNEDGMGNYVFYPSVVSNGNADVNADGIVELSVDKGNNESIVRIPFEGVYPMDTNPLGLKPKIQPSIIGETGAAELDSSYKNVNNLAIAKKMKAQKKSKQFIKTATGWELGPDGFWRMEISDSKFSYTDDHLNKIIDKAIDGDFTYKPLSSVITNKQLFQAYPELKNINVVFGKTGKVRFSPTAVYNMSPTTGAVYLSGGYGDTHIIINSETLREKGTDELLSYMEHEIQHYIQDKEGFTQGSDTKDEFNTLISKIEDEIFAKSGKPLERKLSNELNRLSTERNALAYNPSEENKQKSIDLYNQKLSIYDNYAKDVLKIGSVYDKAYQNYKNKFGEIEARNVQLRRLIPFELRADMLFEATQDVKNKDAIFTKNDKKIISKLETYRNKSILQQAKNLGFVAVVDKDTEGNAIVMSNTVIPAEPIGTQEFTQNKQVIIPSMFGTPVVEVIEPGEMGAKDVKNVSYNAGPIRELSKFQTTSLGKVFMEYFTPTGGATVMQKELMEQLAGEQSFVANKIKENALALRKLIDNFVNNEGKKVGLTKQTVQTIVNKAMDGEIDPKTGKPFLDQLPSNLADGVVNARQTITNLQEILANSGLLPADMALTIAMSQGTYMKDSFAAFEVKPYNWLMGKITGKKNKYFKGVSEQTRNKVKSYFVSQALLGKLDSGFNVSLADYKKNYEDPYFALLAQDPTAQMAATRQAGLAKDQAFKELEEKARRFAQSKIDEIEDYNPNGDIMFTLSGAPIKMTDYIEKNPNLAPEMKEYLGYIVDPATSFKLTAMKLNRMLYSHQTMQQMKNEGLLSGDVVPSSEATPKGWIKLGKISQRDSKTMIGTASDEVDAVNKYGPLKGCSVSPEFYQLVFNTPVTGNWYYRNIASPVKKNLAVVNVKNIIRNVFGYTYFGGASGAIPEAIMYVGPLMKVNKNKIKTAKEFKDWFVNVFEEAQKRGINTSIEYSEIRRMADQLGDNEEILNSVRKSGNPAFELYNKVSDIIFNAPKSVSDAFGKVIYYGDAIPKTLMFEVFRNTNAYDMARTTFYGLSEEQKEQASRIAERKVKATTVTDSRTIKGADILQRKVGIFGSFPRFTAEAIRTFINCHYIMVNPSFLYEGEEFSSNKDQNKIIKTRMNRKNRFVALAGLSFYYGAFDILRSLMGLGDDDDDLQKIDIPSNGILEALQLVYKEKGTMTQSEALRKMLPEYDKFAELQFKVNEDGTVSYRNESTADPFGIMGQAYRSILYSDGPASAVTNLVKNVATPAIGLEVAFGTALEVFNGENSKGEPIYAPDDLTSKQFQDIAAYFARKTGPNIYSSGMRYRDLVRMGKREPGESIASNALDFASYTFGEGVLGRESVIDVKKKLQSQVSKIKQDWTTDARLYSGEFYRTIDPKDREAINEQRDEAARRNAYKLHKLVLAAYALNLSEAEVKDVFKKSAISKKVRKAALRGGEYLDKLDVKDIEEKD